MSPNSSVRVSTSKRGLENLSRPGDFYVPPQTTGPCFSKQLAVRQLSYFRGTSNVPQLIGPCFNKLKGV